MKAEKIARLVFIIPMLLARPSPSAGEQTLQTIWDNRAQVQRLDREMLEAVGRELSPQQRAKMMIFFATFVEEARAMQQRAQARQHERALKATAERAAHNVAK